MGKIIYNEKTVLDAKNGMERCNTSIIDAVEKIGNELMTMERTLNTPNSKKYIALYQDQVNTELNYLKNRRDSYNTMFNIIGGEYHNYADKVESTVGDNNG